MTRFWKRHWRRRTMKSKAGTDTEFFRRRKFRRYCCDRTSGYAGAADSSRAMYNIVDSFLGKIFRTGADGAFGHLSVAAHHHCAGGGTGVGVNTLHGRAWVVLKMPVRGGRNSRNRDASGALEPRFIFAIFSIFCMRPYVLTSANTPEAIRECSLSTDRSSVSAASGISGRNWTKVHQSQKLCNRPMVAQDVRGADEYHA